MQKTTPSLTVDNHTLIKVLMSLNRLTQVKLAARAGVNQSNFSGWLRGMTSVLSMEKQLKLLKTLGVHSSRLDDSVVHEWSIKEDVLDRANVEGMQQLGSVLRYLFAREDNVTSKFCLHVREDKPEVGIIEFNQDVKYESVVFVKINAPEKSHLVQIFEKLEIHFDSIMADGATFKIKSAHANPNWPSRLDPKHHQLSLRVEDYNQKYLHGYTKTAQTLKNVLKQTEPIALMSIAEFKGHGEIVAFKVGRNELDLRRAELDELIEQLTNARNELVDISNSWSGLVNELYLGHVKSETDKTKVPNGGKDNGSAGLDEKRRV